MELIYLNKEKVLTNKKMIFKVNNRNYLLYVTGSPVNNLATVCFGEYKNNCVYAVEPSEMPNFTKFLKDFANNRVSGNQLYSQIKEPNTTVTIIDGAKTQLPQTIIDSFIVTDFSQVKLETPSSISIQSPAPTPTTSVQSPEIASTGEQSKNKETISVPSNQQAKPKKQKTWLIILLAVILSLALGFGYFMYKFFSSPKNLLVWSVSKTLTNMENVIGNDNFEEIENFIESNDKIDFFSTTELNYNAQTNSPSLKLEIGYLDNKSTKTSGFTASLSADNQKLVGLDGILANDRLYFTISNILKEYYYTSFKYTSLFVTDSSEDRETISKAFITATYETIKDKDFNTTKNQNISINGQSVSTTKYSYELTKDRVLSIVEDFCIKITDNTEIKKAFMNVYSLSEDKVATTLDSLINSISTSEYKTVIINFYIKEFKDTALIEIVQDNQSYRIYTYDNSVEVVISDDKIYDFIVTKDPTTQNYTVNYSYNNKKVVEGVINENGEFNFNYEAGEGRTIVINGTIKINEITENSNYTVDFDSNIILKEKTSEDDALAYTLSSAITLKTGGTVNTAITNSAIDIANMTDEDKYSLSMYLSMFNSYLSESTESY